MNPQEFKVAYFGYLQAGYTSKESFEAAVDDFDLDWSNNELIDSLDKMLDR